uniref:Uncharacterized protein n=1 Tax=Tanacetum cinerariifolium TaxID=118510 RepID=A0A6L2KL80_TANCI|nr:hypothetical protein [Tanacetum cinerariifolium]
MTLLNKLMETYATPTQKVANLEKDKIAQALEIVKLKQRVRKLKKKRKTKHLGLKRLRKVGGKIDELDANKDVTLVYVDVEVEIDTNIQGMMVECQAKAYNLDLQNFEKVLSMQDTDEPEPAKVEEVLEVKPKDKGKGILIEEPKHLKVQAQINMDEAFARQLEAKLNANTIWNDVIKQKGEKEIEEEGSKRKGENLEQDTAKKQRIDEDAEELKRHLQIVANDDDDVYTEATHLASNVPVVDYQINHEHNKPYYKIIRADGTHQLLLSFISLLNNF